MTNEGKIHTLRGCNNDQESRHMAAMTVADKAFVRRLLLRNAALQQQVRDMLWVIKLLAAAYVVMGLVAAVAVV